MSGMTVPVESQLKYLRRRVDELTQIQASLQNSPDWELMKKVGHQIKGNAMTFGFSQLTEFGKDLEVAALHTDLQKALDASHSLQEQIQNLLKGLH